MALSKRVGVALTAEEYRALRWVARQEQLQRYPGSRAPKRPGAGNVLKKMSVEQAVERYRNRPAEVETPAPETE